MIETKYGEIPQKTFRKYIESLINKTYKILPLKEEESETLNEYIESYLRELIGGKQSLYILSKEPRFITVMCTLEYLILNNPSTNIYKKEVFKCIKILSDIKSDLNKDGDSNG